MRFDVPEVLKHVQHREKTRLYEDKPRFFCTDRKLRPAGEDHYKFVVAIADLLSLSLDEAMILLNGISQITSATIPQNPKTPKPRVKVIINKWIILNWMVFNGVNMSIICKVIFLTFFIF